MANPFFTIGHSTRSIDEFTDLLRSTEVQLVVDVRTIPRSRTNPQYNRDTLPETLAARQIGYEHIAELGGRRGKQRGVAPGGECVLDQSELPQLCRLRRQRSLPCRACAGFAVGPQRRCAIMCAEAVWWRCHRRIIADYLISAGESVFHILSPDHVVPATETPAARRGPGGTLTYPASGLTTDSWPG